MIKLRIVEFENGLFGVEKRFLKFFSLGFMDNAGFPTEENPYFWFGDRIRRHCLFHSLAGAKYAMNRIKEPKVPKIKRIIE